MQLHFIMSQHGKVRQPPFNRKKTTLSLAVKKATAAASIKKKKHGAQ